MAFTTITADQVAPGQPVTTDLFDTVRLNFDDHESRLTTIEASANVYRPYEFAFIGVPNADNIQDGILHDRVFFDQTVLGVKLYIIDDGTAGTLTVDVEKKTGVGAWTSLLNAPIAVASGGGDLSITSGTLSASTSLLAGDLLRLNIDTVMTNMKDFTVFLEFEGA